MRDSFTLGLSLSIRSEKGFPSGEVARVGLWLSMKAFVYSSIAPAERRVSKDCQAMTPAVTIPTITSTHSEVLFPLADLLSVAPVSVALYLLSLELAD